MTWHDSLFGMRNGADSKKDADEENARLKKTPRFEERTSSQSEGANSHKEKSTFARSLDALLFLLAHP